MPVLFCLKFYCCCFYIQQQLCFSHLVSLGFQIPQEVSCKDPLGMEDQQISDSAVTASSTMAPSTLLYASGNARLHYKGGARRNGGWIPAVSDHSQWLQINFESDRHVTGIATQGYYQGLYYVKSYSLQYVDDRGYLQQYLPEWHTKVSIMCNQEPITRSLQLPHIPVTAFSQTDLFLVCIYLEFKSPQEPQ